MRMQYALAIAALGIIPLVACGGSSAQAPTMTSETFAPDPAPPVLTGFSVRRPSDGDTAHFGSNAGEVALEFHATTSFIAQIQLSPDATGDRWLLAGEAIVDGKGGTATVPFGLSEAEGITRTQRVRARLAGVGSAKDYTINWMP
jgi:hypothetical protein